MIPNTGISYRLEVRKKRDEPITTEFWKKHRKVQEKLLTFILYFICFNPLDPPRKHQKTKGFLMFPRESKGNTEKERLNEGFSSNITKLVFRY